MDYRFVTPQVARREQATRFRIGGGVGDPRAWLGNLPFSQGSYLSDHIGIDRPGHMENAIVGKCLNLFVGEGAVPAVNHRRKVSLGSCTTIMSLPDQWPN